MRGACAALIVLCAGPAAAVELAREEDGARLDAGGFYKNLLFGLVTAQRAAGALDAQLLRLTSGFRHPDGLWLEVAWQGQLLLTSDPAFLGGGTLGATIGGAGDGPQRRLVPLEGTLAQGPHTLLTHNLDRLALRVALPFGDLTVGRQVLSWGTGRFFNPTDVLSPFPPTVIDREVRRGFDAVRLAVALGDLTQLDLLWLPQAVGEENGGVVRFRTNIKGWDGSLSAGKYVRDFVFGFDVVGDVGPLQVHAEGAYTLQWLERGGVGEHFFRGVAGADFRPHEKLGVAVEYAFNGFGTTDPSRYAQVLASARARRGELFGAGKHVLAAAASLRANEVFSASLSALLNLTDPSALAIAAFEYSFAQAALVRGGVYVPIGRGPDPALAATPSLGLRSEYGSGSFGAFAQVGVYVP